MPKNKNPNGIKTWEEAAEQLTVYRQIQCSLGRRKAALEDALRKVQETYQAEIDELAVQAEIYADSLRAFAEDRKKAGDFKATADGGAGRTRVSQGVEIGWRWGKPYLHIPKKFLDAAIPALEEISGDTYVRRDPKLLKEVLKADMEKAAANGGVGEALLARLNALNITLDQDEEFVLEVVKTE